MTTITTFAQYVEALEKLHRGPHSETVEKNLLDSMQSLWYKLTEDEQHLVGEMSEALRKTQSNKV